MYMAAFNNSQPLPLGRSDFAGLRMSGAVYVDKTELVFAMCRDINKIFLARPRRFGKSLLVSTFESLFRHGLRDFQGLAIEKLWTDKTYDVLRLDFSEMKEFSDGREFREKFVEKISARISVLDPTFSDASSNFATRLSLWLNARPTNSLVILVDEYDAPLTACLDKPEQLGQVRSTMSEFFLTLKANDRCLRFFFMTGITKLSHTSIFSAFNNLQDISLDSRYGALLGYTSDEIRTCFASYLERAQQELNLDSDELFTALHKNYDGFAFDRRASQRVFCPWSVLNFLSSPEEGFQNYWYQSGGRPTVLLKYLSNHAIADPAHYSETKQIRLSDLTTAQEYDDLNGEVLLTQAGYLTLKSVRPNGFALLGYPNQEVALSMAQLYADELMAGQALDEPDEEMLREVMAVGSVEDVVFRFNRAFGAIDYLRYPVRDEASCRAYLQVLLIGAAMLPCVENHSALGRSDLEVDAGSRHWVLELKYARSSAQVPRLLEEAATQLRQKRYGESSDHERLQLALVFDGSSRQFVAWIVVDD